MTNGETEIQGYSLAMRLLHWLRAILLIGLVAIGWYMTSLPDESPAKYVTLYPNHKQFGVLTFIIVCVALLVRSQSRIPQPPAGLARWEARLAHITHRALYALALIVPLMGYAMSSSYTQSDGVPFFVAELPELLPKNDSAFVVFQWLHKVLAYSLLGLAVLHILGALKHRFFDRTRGADVFGRML